MDVRKSCRNPICSLAPLRSLSAPAAANPTYASDRKFDWDDQSYWR
jgi:hypothetical protein